ncbi:hypothetical protein BDZ94DRAFT_345425 [Collybia nuda]|uniref:Uncharacterized protein n=1 Tax=Collybia nuda TaxID=64659 RepID=A0A9P5YBM5_9AGAR|nr:hypothetical protein BDZ94DRAFT_345425 [Collybia nuda]
MYTFAALFIIALAAFSNAAPTRMEDTGLISAIGSSTNAGNTITESLGGTYQRYDGDTTPRTSRLLGLDLSGISDSVTGLGGNTVGAVGSAVGSAANLAGNTGLESFEATNW